MGRKKWVDCDYCGEEILEKDATYVEGRPYCKKCQRDAERFIDTEGYDGDYDGDDYGDDEDDDDYDDD